jgi:hypothetical protein
LSREAEKYLLQTGEGREFGFQTNIKALANP